MLKIPRPYRLVDLESNVIMESRDVQFLENKTRDDSTNESTSLFDGVNETNIPIGLVLLFLLTTKILNFKNKWK